MNNFLRDALSLLLFKFSFHKSSFSIARTQIIESFLIYSICYIIILKITVLFIHRLRNFTRHYHSSFSYQRIFPNEKFFCYLAPDLWTCLAWLSGNFWDTLVEKEIDTRHIFHSSCIYWVSSNFSYKISIFN